MKINKIKEMSSPELEKELGELKKELFKEIDLPQEKGKSTKIKYNLFINNHPLLINPFYILIYIYWSIIEIYIIIFFIIF